jgi:hypothetical protein
VKGFLAGWIIGAIFMFLWYSYASSDGIRIKEESHDQEIAKLQHELQAYKTIDAKISSVNEKLEGLETVIKECDGGLNWIRGIGYQNRGVK